MRAQINFLALHDEYDVPRAQEAAQCIEAINATIACPSTLASYVRTDYSSALELPELQSFCAPTCTSSIEAYVSGVSVSCGEGVKVLEGLPASFLADRLFAYHKRTCLKDESGRQYCNSKSTSCLRKTLSLLTIMSAIMSQWPESLSDKDVAFHNLPKEKLCSSCFLSYLQAIQDTPYSNYDESFVQHYSTVQTGSVLVEVVRQEISSRTCPQSAISIDLWMPNLGLSSPKNNRI